MATALRDLIAFPGGAALQNLHPLVVHFPIAFLTAAMLLYWAAWITRRDDWAWPGLLMLACGAFGGLFAIITGLRARDSVMVAQSVRDHLLLRHEYTMIAAWALSLLALAWAWRARPLPRAGRIGFMFLLLIMSLILAKGADYGGWMVFGYNAGGSLPQPIEFAQ
jgi:uncharacterized membrane protein